MSQDTRDAEQLQQGIQTAHSNAAQLHAEIHAQMWATVINNPKQALIQAGITVLTNNE